MIKDYLPGFAKLAVASAILVPPAAALSAQAPAVSGAALGLTWASLTTWMLHSAKRKALQIDTGGAGVLEFVAYGAVARLICLAVIGWIGFHSGLTFGLAGFLAYGLGYIGATLVEMKFLAPSRLRNGI